MQTGSRHEWTRMTAPRVFGVTGWKNAGKTTLVERLVAEFAGRGWRVSTIKHAHHDVDIDRSGTDSFRHRAAGATEVALVGGQRYAIMREEANPSLTDVVARLSPCDIVLVEGYKREPHGKIEVRADNANPLAASDPAIVAIASDIRPLETHLPWFRRDDIGGIADFIADRISDEPTARDEEPR